MTREVRRNLLGVMAEHIVENSAGRRTLTPQPAPVWRRRLMRGLLAVILLLTVLAALAALTQRGARPRSTPMRIGYTGTRDGMTPTQFQSFVNVMANLTNWGQKHEFHHGDCVGGDAQAHDHVTVAYGDRAIIHIHPPNDSRFRAYCDQHGQVGLTRTVTLVLHPPAPFLVRDHHIVEETEVLVATPKQIEEQLRSGTWATYRYAKQRNRPIVLVQPDGVVRCIPEGAVQLLQAEIGAAHA